MQVTYNGKPAIVRKEEFYCKAGPYTHKMRVGWVVEQGGKIVLGGKSGRTCDGAARYEYPDFPTRKGLLECLEY